MILSYQYIIDFQEEDEEAKKLKEQRVAEYAARKSKSEFFSFE